MLVVTAHSIFHFVLVQKLSAVGKNTSELNHTELSWRQASSVMLPMKVQTRWPAVKFRLWLVCSLKNPEGIFKMLMVRRTWRKAKMDQIQLPNLFLFQNLNLMKTSYTKYLWFVKSVFNLCWIEHELPTLFLGILFYSLSYFLSNRNLMHYRDTFICKPLTYRTYQAQR